MIFEGRIIKIKGILYELTCCTNCGEVHAFHPNIKTDTNTLDKIDNKIKCCKNPDNHFYIAGAIEKINRFIKKYKDRGGTQK